MKSSNPWEEHLSEEQRHKHELIVTKLKSEIKEKSWEQERCNSLAISTFWNQKTGFWKQKEFSLALLLQHMHSEVWSLTSCFFRGKRRNKNKGNEHDLHQGSETCGSETHFIHVTQPFFKKILTIWINNGFVALFLLSFS